MRKVYKAVVEKEGKWWVGEVPEVPGAFTQAKTLRELRENLQEVVSEQLAYRKRLEAQKKIQIDIDRRRSQ